MLATAMQLGPGGPMDPEYSAAWVEANLHKHEAAEFEETARRMGYPANSVTMDPVPSAEEQAGIRQMISDWYDRNARIAVAGEYHDLGAFPGEKLGYPLEVAGRHAANVGLDEFQKAQRVFMLARTLDQRGIPLEDPLEMTEQTEEVESEEGEVEKEDEGWTVQGVYVPPTVEPGERITPAFANIMERLRESMKEIDRDVLSLENNYDEFLEKKSPPSALPTTPNSTQEASP